MNLKKYDVVLLDLDPPKGHVQAGVRPAVIAQSNLFNRRASTVLIVPLTSNSNKLFPCEFWIEPSKKNGLGSPSRFLGSQLTALDKEFIIKKIGRLEAGYHHLVQEALGVALDWDDSF